MKAYILSKADLDLLLTMIDRDPQHGFVGGSSNSLSERDMRIYSEAHRFYNYQIREWINKISKDAP